MPDKDKKYKSRLPINNAEDVPAERSASTATIISRTLVATGRETKYMMFVDPDTGIEKQFILPDLNYNKQKRLAITIKALKNRTIPPVRIITADYSKVPGTKAILSLFSAKDKDITEEQTVARPTKVMSAKNKKRRKINGPVTVLPIANKY